MTAKMTIILITLVVLAAGVLIVKAELIESQPESLYYLTNAGSVVEFIQSSNDKCSEGHKVYSNYREIETGRACGDRLRYRPWICKDGSRGQGVDVEVFKGKPCGPTEYELLRGE